MTAQREPVRGSSVDVLIVNFRTPALTVEAVRSALLSPAVGLVIVVDNASGDDSVDTLRAAFLAESRVLVIESERNGGFGAGNNLAAKSGTSKYLLLLNSDATIDPGAIDALVAHHERFPRSGVTAPVVLSHGTTSQQRDSYGVFPTPTRILLRRTSPVIDLGSAEWVSGCSFLVERAVFHAMGGFDERIFMYLEDVLFCWQIRRRGLSVRICTEATIQHRGGMSTDGSRSRSKLYGRAQDHYLRVTGVGRITGSVIRTVRGLRTMARFGPQIRTSRPAASSTDPENSR